MSWLHKNKRIWRKASLGVLLIALLGPWAFDRIMVPAEYPCEAPSVRLEGDFCGWPLSGFWNLRAIAGEFAYRVVGTITGEVAFAGLLTGAGIFLGALVIVLPFFSTTLLMLVGERRPLQIFNLAAWGLALAVVLLMGLSGYPWVHWALWGAWLYAGLAVVVLALEALEARMPGKGNSLAPV